MTPEKFKEVLKYIEDNKADTAMVAVYLARNDLKMTDMQCQIIRERLGVE